MLKQTFLHHLNRLYFAKSYLKSRIADLTDIASSHTLKLALGEFSDDLKKQIERMQRIYELIDEIPSDKNCNPIKSIIRDNFCLSDAQEHVFYTDTDIMLYVQMLEHINITACRMLKVIAVELNYAEISQLLIESFDESVDNDELFMQVAKEYFGA